MASRFMGNPSPNSRPELAFTVMTTTESPWHSAFWARWSKRRFSKRNDVSRRLGRTGGTTWRIRYIHDARTLGFDLTISFRLGSRLKVSNFTTHTLLGLSARRLLRRLRRS